MFVVQIKHTNEFNNDETNEYKLGIGNEEEEEED